MGVGVGAGVDFGVTTGVEGSTGVDVFFSEDVNEGPTTSHEPGDQNLQRSVVPVGTSIAAQG